MEGPIATYTSGTGAMTVTVDRFVGGGTFASWAIGVAGDVGATGATGSTGSTGAAGAGYLATSATSLTITIASKTLTTQAGLAYAVGMRVRVANSGSNYMEGLITAYGTTSMTVNVDRVIGSGTFTSWSLGIAGDVGATGANGSTGAAGTNATGLLTGGTTTSILATRYVGFGYGLLGTTDAAVSAYLPAAGTAGTFYAAVTTAPGSGTNWILTLMKNGAATTITCTIAAATLQCSDLTHSVSFAAGDTISVRVTSTGLPTGTPLRFSLGYTG